MAYFRLYATISPMTYDFYAIVDTAAADEAEKKLLTLVAKDGFKVTNYENWGKKPLSYPIKKKTEGTYCVMVLEGTGNPNKLNERFKLDDTILRTLILKSVQGKSRRAKKVAAKKTESAAKVA